MGTFLLSPLYQDRNHHRKTTTETPTHEIHGRHRRYHARIQKAFRMREALAFITAILHRVRGQENDLFTGINDRIIVTLGMSAAFFLLGHNIIDAAIIGAGYFFYIIWGWGAYFTTPADFDYIKSTGLREPEIPWIDWLIGKLPSYRVVQNFVGMVLRGLYAAPVMFALGWHHNDLNAAAIEAACFAVLMGCAYTLTAAISRLTARNFDYTAYAEAITGFSFGFAVGYFV